MSCPISSTKSSADSSAWACERKRGVERPSPLRGELPPTRDWGAALFIVAVDRNALPHAVEMIRIGARESIDCGAIDGIDDKNAADRRFAVIGDECARGDYVNRVLF